MSFQKNFSFFALLVLICQYSSYQSLPNVCDPNLNSNDWPAETITQNTKIESGGIFLPNDATTIQECVKQCCEKSDCNFILFQEMSKCLLITCQQEDACNVIPNKRKSLSEPIDYIVAIRSLEKRPSILERYLQSKKEELKSIQGLSNNEVTNAPCVLSSISEKNDCPVNELCQLKQSTFQTFECICPRELNFIRIEKVCREYLKLSQGCTMYLNECNTDLNEECISKHKLSKHGTCQCKVGYRRNSNTFKCELFSMQAFLSDPSLNNNNNYFNSEVSSEQDQHGHNKSKKLKNPTGNEYDDYLNSKIEKGEEALIKEILNEFGEDSLTKSTSNPIKTVEDKQNIKSSTESIDSSKRKSTESSMTLQTSSIDSSTIKSTTIEKTTTTIPTTVSTDAPNVYTANLEANAGEDIHVYYPSTMCILNGTLSKFKSNDFKSRITKWLWSKVDSSPAFGKFYSSNEAPVVVYEQLVEGVYKFIFKIWTNTNEFSQDTVYVHVHSSLNTSLINDDNDENENISSNSKLQLEATKLNTNKLNSIEFEFINDNLIQLVLNIRPSHFTEFLKKEFISKLEILLQQPEFKLVRPKIFLTNTKYSIEKLKTSNVLLELFVCEDYNPDSLTGTQSTENLADGQIIENKQLIKLAQEVSFNYMDGIESQTLIKKITQSRNLIKMLKSRLNRNRTIFDWLVSLVKTAKVKIENASTSSQTFSEYLGLDIVGISKFACGNYKNNRQSCSNHGECDEVTKNCICDKYWMPNLYLYYFNNEADLTNGNNCEWNILLFGFLSALASVLFILIISSILKFCLYYLFCCCCCCKRRFKHNAKESISTFKKKKLYARSLNQDDEDEDLLEENSTRKKISNYKKSALNKLKNNLSSKNKTHKYALLENQEDFDKKKDDRMGAKLKYSLEDDEDDDDNEDVLFDHNLSMNSSSAPSPAIKNSNKRADNQSHRK